MCFAEEPDIVYSCIRKTKCFPLKGFISLKTRGVAESEWRNRREETPDGNGISISLISIIASPRRLNAEPGANWIPIAAPV